MTSTPLLEVEHLSMSFQTSRGPLLAVDDVAITVGHGETLGIVGETGSGKSALVRTIMNLQPRSAVVAPESRILFEGEDLRSLSKARARHVWGREISMIFQDPMTSLNPVKTIGAQMSAPMRYHLDISRKEALARAEDLLARSGSRRRPDGCASTRMSCRAACAERVMIAIALSCDPKLFIADEPTTALDVTVQKQILDLLKKLQAGAKMAVILITHDLGVAAGRTDRIAVMYAGRHRRDRADPAAVHRDAASVHTSAPSSIPRIEQPSHTRLEAIAGRPPDLVEPPPGCRFAPRCPYVQPRCSEEEPPLNAAGAWPPRARCWFPVGTEAGRDALEHDLAAHVPQAEEAVAGDPGLIAKLELKETGDESRTVTDGRNRQGAPALGRRAVARRGSRGRVPRVRRAHAAGGVGYQPGRRQGWRHSAWSAKRAAASRRRARRSCS